MKNRKKLLFVFLYLVYSAVYICRINLSIASPILKEEGIITETELGWITGVFFVCYAVGRLINGFLGDHLKTRVMIAVAMTVIAAANIMFGLLPYVVAMVIFWGVNGYAQSMVWGPLLRIVSQHYEPQKRNTVMSILASSVSLGSVAGIIIAEVSVTGFGVRAGLIIPGVVSVMAALITIFTFPDDIVQPQTEGKKSKIRISPKEIGVMFIPAFLHGMIKDNINTWAPILFVEKFGIDFSKMAWFVFVIPLLGFVGRIVYPLLMKICKNRENIVTLIGFGICVVCMGLLFVFSSSVIVTAICLSLVSAAIQIINTSLLSIFPMKFADRNAVSSVSGYMDLATYSGTGLSSVLYGYIIKAAGFTGMFSVWLGGALISTVIFVIKIIGEKSNAKVDSNV